MKLGIAGAGFVGGTLWRWLQMHTNHDIKVKDLPGKGMNDDFTGLDALFICVPVPTNKNGTQDLSNIEQVLSANKGDYPVFIRSTVLPGTCDYLSKEFSKQVFAMPEFLTERRAYDDFRHLPLMVGCVGFPIGGIAEIFPGKTIYECTNVEAETAKYVHNVFGAMKVGYFNIIHRLCNEIGADYSTVINLACLTGFIETTHTQVPGPDGRYGFGGKCFPSNLSSFIRFLADQKLPGVELFKQLESDNIHFRDKLGGEK